MNDHQALASPLLHGIAEQIGPGESADRPASVDARLCPDCLSEIQDAHNRRYRYPFASCAVCGPRYSRGFFNPTAAGTPSSRCADCQAEYDDPNNRHYQDPNLCCHACGPRARLQRADGRVFDLYRYTALDDVDAASALLLAGHILAVKGQGGYRLCCDATNDAAVQTLRLRKQRPHRPLALMFRDTAIMSRYVDLNEAQAQVLQSEAAPIVLLPKATASANGAPLSPAVAAHQAELGCMLPATALQHLLLMRVDRPIVCTNGSPTDAPACVDDDDAHAQLKEVADWFLVHERQIVNPVDDSIVTFMGYQPRVLRRARGYAPWILAMPPGLTAAAPILATGSDRKSVGVLTGSDQAVIAPHTGDLDHPRALHDYRQTLRFLINATAQEPAAVAIDIHPASHAAQFGQGYAAEHNLPLFRIQHHHAHIAACLAENQYPDKAAPVLGIVLDGLGYGVDGGLWGGEWLVANYGSFQRVGTLQPIRLLSGDRATREPWRCLYAHLRSEMSWSELHHNFGDLEVIQSLWQRPITLLDHMLETGLSAPLASSANGLFDAVAAALGLYREGTSYEGQAGVALQALVSPEALAETEPPYPFAIQALPSGLQALQPRTIWRNLLGDLWAGVHPSLIAGRFYRGLGQGIVQLTQRLQKMHEGPQPLQAVALSGDAFQNRILFEAVLTGLHEAGFQVLTHRILPPNDGCIALGQAAICAQRQG